MSNEEQSGLNRRVEQIKQQLRDVIVEMNTVLAADLPAFPPRIAKKYFLSGAERSEAMTEDQLRSFKQEITDISTGLVPKVLETLSNPSIWLTSSPNESSSRRDLSQNTSVWEELASVAKATEAVLQNSPLGPCEDGVHYRTPTFFIDGLYMPGLIEKYWALLEHYHSAKEEERVQKTQRTMKSLAQRWEDS